MGLDKTMVWTESASNSAPMNCPLCGSPMVQDGQSGAYADSKREHLGWTRKSAAMFSSSLRVNAVAPGPVMPPEGVHELAGETPLGRPTPEDVASAVAFLLDAQRTSGCVVPVDGGQSL